MVSANRSYSNKKGLNRAPPNPLALAPSNRRSTTLAKVAPP